jgi:peptide/nickel transport system permease protein
MARAPAQRPAPSPWDCNRIGAEGRLPVLKLVLNRLGLGVLTLFAASVLIFVGTEILPGDLASAILQNTATPEALAKMRLDLGLNQPAYIRFFHWLFAALHGDFGKSLANNRDVLTEIAPRFANTMFLAAYAAVVAVPLAIGLGLLAAIRQGGVFDRLVNVVTLMTISVPEYFLAYLLIKYVAVDLGWFPSLASVSSDTPFFDRLYIAFLPMVTLVLVIIAHMMRMTRASVLAVMASPYIEMAILKGLSKSRIVIRHALPNALAPIIAVVALNLAYLIVGVVVVETVFVYPGLGQLMVDEVSKHDVPVVQACGLIFAATFIVLNMIADILAILSNPRLRQPR